MRQDNPLMLAAVALGFLAQLGMWLVDLHYARRGRPRPAAFPGATPTTGGAVIVAVAGAMVLLAVETIGEYALGIVAEQSRMSIGFALFSLAAAFGEELVFRGYLVVTGRGRGWLVGSAVAFSALFALAHPFLWRWGADGLAVQVSVKALFSTAMIFAGSLWFYYARFQSRNPAWSLIPCFAAHLVKNLGVIAIKAAQGYLGG